MVGPQNATRCTDNHARVGRRSLAHPWCLRGGPLASGPYARGGERTPQRRGQATTSRATAPTLRAPSCASTPTRFALSRHSVPGLPGDSGSHTLPARHPLRSSEAPPHPKTDTPALAEPSKGSLS